jgi:hypothetical protein
MSKAVSHFTSEWLEDYNRRLSAMQQSTPAPKAKKAAKPAPSPSRVREVEGMPYSSDASAVPVAGWDGKQTKTEERYNRSVLGGMGRFEAVCLYLPGGGRYTPDFMTIDGGVVTFHEVKGSYRLQSQGRAWTAFKEACSAFPMWRFVWAHWTGKVWEQKTFESSAINRKGE